MPAAAAAEISIELARSFTGPLPESHRERLRAALDAPSRATWQDAYTIILNPGAGGGLSLWAAVLAVDPAFPRTGPSSRLVWRCPFCEHAATVEQTADPDDQPCPTSECAAKDRRLNRQSELERGWERIPDRALLLAALRYATH